MAACSANTVVVTVTLVFSADSNEQHLEQRAIHRRPISTYFMYILGEQAYSLFKCVYVRIQLDGWIN